jgi:hypothetical protein
VIPSGEVAAQMTSYEEDGFLHVYHIINPASTWMTNGAEMKVESTEEEPRIIGFPEYLVQVTPSGEVARPNAPLANALFAWPPTPLYHIMNFELIQTTDPMLM